MKSTTLKTYKKLITEKNFSENLYNDECFYSSDYKV